jgi:hypothetical protein
MSNEIAIIESTIPITVSTFFGGTKRGKMIQLTADTGYIQLTAANAEELILVLTKWLE